ncbi:MAG: LOG family protein [Pirellulaceae bacterium]
MNGSSEPPSEPFLPEALGEDEKQRPQPADESSSDDASRDWIAAMRKLADQLERESIDRGDLKILHRSTSELHDAFRIFGPYRRRRKVTLFGSARTPSTHPAYHQAETFASMMAGHDWMVVTGSGGGIMEAGNRGAGRAMSMGLNIQLPFEARPNRYIDGDPKLIEFKYFFTRKLMLVKECSAAVACPGGFGTLDEMLEVLTLLQTGKQTMIPLVLLDAPSGRFWRHFEEFYREQLEATGWVGQEDRNLFRILDQADEAVDEILRFYRNYHSMRYVGSRLVLRIQKPISNNQLDRLNRQFAHLLLEGQIEQRSALRQEANEPELAELPRLAMRLDRRQAGGLRSLIDAINGAGD